MPFFYFKGVIYREFIYNNIKAFQKNGRSRIEDLGFLGKACNIDCVIWVISWLKM